MCEDEDEATREIQHGRGIEGGYVSKVFTSPLDECALPGSPATFSMHDSVARRRRSIFFGGRVALRVL